jgi:ankyrin repeat protein
LGHTQQPGCIHGAHTDARDVNSQTPLFLAAKNGCYDTVCELVENMHVDVNGELALHGACFHGDKKIVTYLLGCGADVNMMGKFVDKDDSDFPFASSLHIAVQEDT